MPQKYLHILTKSSVFGKEGVRLAFLAALFILVALGAFGLGRLSALSETKGRVLVRPPGSPKELAAPVLSPQTASSSAPADAALGAHAFVASKNGSKYYGPGCTGASRIKPANQVWFGSSADAEAAGYTLAANCTLRPQ